MTDRIDISAELRALCDKLGIHDYDAVAELVITPATVRMVVYKRNDDGNKYLDETGYAPCNLITTRVIT